MATKEFLEKIILGRDVHKDLAIAEKERDEAMCKYNNAHQTISTLKEKNRVLSDSLNASKQELSSLKREKDSIDALLSQLLNDEELCDAKAILEGRLNNKKALFGNLTEELRSSQDKQNQMLDQLEKLKEQKNLLENDVKNLTRDTELLKEKSKQKEEQKTKRDNAINQRKGIRDNLSTLKDEWQKTLDFFKAKIVNAGSHKDIEELKRELKDYERRVNNAIEISVK